MFIAGLVSRWPTTARPPVPLFSCDWPPPTSGTRTSPGRTPPDFGKSDGSGLYGYTHAAVTNPVLGVWSSVKENFVLPNFVIFGWFTFITETCLAIFLFLGLGTRFWALVGVLQSFAIYFTVGGLPAEWKWSYFLMAATHLALLGLAAGRVLGLDQVLRLRVTGSSLVARAYRLAS